jgi:hypothetical protein
VTDYDDWNQSMCSSTAQCQRVALCSAADRQVKWLSLHLGHVSFIVWPLPRMLQSHKCKNHGLKHNYFHFIFYNFFLQPITYATLNTVAVYRTRQIFRSPCNDADIIVCYGQRLNSVINVSLDTQILVLIGQPCRSNRRGLLGKSSYCGAVSETICSVKPLGERPDISREVKGFICW